MRRLTFVLMTVTVLVLSACGGGSTGSSGATGSGVSSD